MTIQPSDIELIDRLYESGCRRESEASRLNLRTIVGEAARDGALGNGRFHVMIASQFISEYRACGEVLWDSVQSVLESSAVSALIAFHDGKQTALLVKRRGFNSVAVHVGMVHIAPSFMFQPGTSDLDNECSIIHNLYREYLEELFDVQEPGEREGDWQYFYGDLRLRFLQALIAEQKVQIYLTGLAINLINLRPEVCLLIHVNTPDWYSHHRSHIDQAQRFQYNDDGSAPRIVAHWNFLVRGATIRVSIEPCTRSQCLVYREIQGRCSMPMCFRSSSRRTRVPSTLGVPRAYGGGCGSPRTIGRLRNVSGDTARGTSWPWSG